MDIKTIRLLAGYNEKTNSQMNGFIAQIDEIQWNRNFNTFFPSIAKMCNHIYIADFSWLKRFSTLRTFEYIEDKVFLNEVNFATDAFVTQKEYAAKREYMDKLIITFANEVTQNDLERNMKYTDLRGTENNRSFGGLILHMFNHQTHHRGMISIYLEMLGIENDYSNLARLV
ncbi:MAG: DinB family protein [Deltaproteobacteria bacterium]|nr:DinB family protein [Candidatus Zymogenaceae bacterium]